MTRSVCDQVAERVALGEDLGELTEHVATCERCQPVVALPAKLGMTRHAVDPGLGFSARMTVGAQHRIAVRRRRRLAAGLAATVACGAFGVFVVTRSPELPPVATQQPLAEMPSKPSDPWADDAAPAASNEDEDVAALVQLADVRRSARASAKWSQIKRPLAAYKTLLQEAGNDPGTAEGETP